MGISLPGCIIKDIFPKINKCLLITLEVLHLKIQENKIENKLSSNQAVVLHGAMDGRPWLKQGKIRDMMK